MDNDAAEEDEGDKVGYGHEGVHAVGEVPHDAQFDDAAQEGGDDVDDAVADDPALAPQVIDGPFAIVVPAKNGAEGEGEQGKGEEVRTHIGNLRESGVGERGTVGKVDVGVSQHAADDDNARDGTDDDGVPEGAAAADQRLSHRIARLGGGCHDGCRAHARLIGEQSAGYTVTGCHHDGGSDEAAAGSLRREGRVDYQLDGWPQEVDVGAENVNAAQYVEEGHERDKQPADVGDAADAAQQDASCQQADDDARDDVVDVVGLVGQGGDSVGLYGVADTERSKGRKHGEKHGKPLPAETALQGVHGAAEHAASLGLHAVLDGEHALGILRRNA